MLIQEQHEFEFPSKDEAWETMKFQMRRNDFESLELHRIKSTNAWQLEVIIKPSLCNL